MHLKRWITGLVLLPFLIWVVIYGGLPFVLFVAVVCLLALREYLGIVLQGASLRAARVWRLQGMIAGPLLVMAAYYGGPELVWLLLALLLISGGYGVLWRFNAEPAVVEGHARQFLGLAYIPLLLTFIVLLRSLPDGAARVFLLLLVIFTSDIGALYFGIYLGRRKLCPGISPGKTVVGALGGLGTGLCFGLLFNYMAPLLPAAVSMPRLPWTLAVLFALLVTAAGQAGDLFESALKRRAQVKDSGALLPGHGGMLDRIDALLFASPVAYGLMRYLG